MLSIPLNQFQAGAKDIRIYKEKYLQQLLKAVYENEAMDVYDYTAAIYTKESDVFLNLKSWVNELVKNKLVRYVDEQKTTIQITNFCKYYL